MKRGGVVFWLEGRGRGFCTQINVVEGGFNGYRLSIRAGRM